MEGNYWRSFTGKQEGVPVPISHEMLWMIGRAGKKNSNNRDFQFWQQNNEPIELNTNGLLNNTLHYTHYNPVEAGFVP